MRCFTSLMAILAVSVPMLCFATDPATRQTDELLALPGQESPVQLTSIPNARSDLHAPGSSDQSLEIFSNEEGVINLHARLDFGQVPTDLGVALPLQPLPNYGIVTSALAYDSTGRMHDLFTTTNILHKIVMLDFDVREEGALTSAIQRTGHQSMKFTWVDPVP